MKEFIVVLVAAGTSAEGERLARALVEEGLAACVNRFPGVQSVYRWEGKIEQSDEEMLMIKTCKELFTALEQRVRELHSYEVPEIIALPVIEGNAAYLRWLEEQVSSAAS